MRWTRAWVLGMGGFGVGVLLIAAWLAVVFQLGFHPIDWVPLAMLGGLYLPVLALACIADECWGYRGASDGLVLAILVGSLAGAAVG